MQNNIQTPLQDVDSLINQAVTTITPQERITSTYLNQTTITNMLNVADEFVKAGCFTGDVKNKQQVFCKIMTGLEMGMSPMEAMNSLYLVNGKFTIWGSAMTKKIKEHGWTIDILESDTTKATVSISKGQERYTETATIQELQSLNSRAVKFAPKDKLRWHAISRLVRYYVPEVTNCGTIYIKEELEEVIGEVKTNTQAETGTIIVRKATDKQINKIIELAKDLANKEGEKFSKEETEKLIISKYKVQRLEDITSKQASDVIALFLDTIKSITPKKKDEEKGTQLDKDYEKLIDLLSQAEENNTLKDWQQGRWDNIVNHFRGTKYEEGITRIIETQKGGVK